MNILCCDHCAFISSDMTLLPETELTITITSLSGENMDGSLIFRRIGETSELVYSIKEGRCKIPHAALNGEGDDFAVYVIKEKERIPAGIVQVRNHPAGTCLYPSRSDQSHIWRVCEELFSFARETKNKLDNHVDGYDII